MGVGRIWKGDADPERTATLEASHIESGEPSPLAIFREEKIWFGEEKTL